MKWTKWACMGLLGMMVSGLAAQTVTEYSRQTPPDYTHSNTRFGNYPGSYFTPRIEWARPLATGPLNLLVFLGMEAAREAVELASRLDARVDTITTARINIWCDTGPNADSFYNDVHARELNDRARILLSPAYGHHAIIIGKLKWSVIPEDIRKAILEKVRGGAALIFVSPWDVAADLRENMQLAADNPLAESIRTTVPLAKIPLDLDLEPLFPDKQLYPPRKIGPLEIQTGKLGQGRVVFLQYNDLLLKDGRDVAQYGYTYHYYVTQLGLTPSVGVEDDDLFYNYYYSILSKAILHATGRESAIRVRADKVDATIARADLPAGPVIFTVSSGDRVLPDSILYYEIRDRQNQVLARGEENLKTAAGPTAFVPRFPVLKQGVYMADVWLKRRGQVLDWASAGVTITDTRYLESVAADKDYFRRDEGIRGKITLAVPVPAKLKVVAELWDTYNRLEQRTVLKQGETTFVFKPIPHPLSRACRIVVKVESGDAVLDEAETWTGLPSGEIEEFQFLVDGAAPTTRPSKVYMALCREYGFTGYDDEHYYPSPSPYQQSAENLARNNFTSVFHVWHMGGFCVGNPPQYGGTGRIGDFQADTWKAGHRKHYTPRIEAYRRYGTLAYGVNNECGCAGGEWNNPAALRDYRIYLQGRYGNIGKLNEIWGSAFASFDDIETISFLDAKVGRQATRWLEQELYKRDRYSQVHEYCAGLIRELDPGARVNIALTQIDDYDIPRMSRDGFSFIQSYLEHFDRENKDQLRGGYYVGYYIGEMSEWHMRTKAWESLFRGGNAICWWPLSNTFTKDLCEPFLGLRQMSAEVRDIHSGMDRLLLSSAKRIDPILILWSNNSRYAGIYHPLETAWQSAVETFANLLPRMGLEYECVGEDVIEEKLQFGPRHRVLILPASQSISRRAVEKIKAFAAAGGLVIADYRPATLDEYLRPYGAVAAPAAPGAVKSETCPKCQGKKIIHLGGAGDPLGNCPMCGGTGVVVKGGEVALTTSALDEVFDFTAKGVKPCGKGYGFFLKGAPAADELRALRNTLIAKGGVKGDMEVLDTLGNTRTDLRSYVFDNGPARLVGVLPDKTVSDPPGEEFILKLDRKMHAYDVRMHSYLGFTDSVTAGILPAQAKVLALLPARIDGLTATADKRAYRPGDVVTLDIRTAPEALKDVTLAVRVEVLKDGKAIRAYAKKLAVKGAATHHLPLALNQDRGEYLVRLTEIISGQRQELKIAVK